eukprot:TRINITY_DN1761_c0_g1_i4.p1 TRINITY_DN1761_c0_g1~~TRINITY_DN1761_c0_g1_i4.p1  ORF type:complete len:300 (+),score=58.65 TRINITY_DN1761_c0_g1_i4:109-1008(+)
MIICIFNRNLGVESESAGLLEQACKLLCVIDSKDDSKSIICEENVIYVQFLEGLIDFCGGNSIETATKQRFVFMEKLEEGVWCSLEISKDDSYASARKFLNSLVKSMKCLYSSISGQLCLNGLLEIENNNSIHIIQSLMDAQELNRKTKELRDEISGGWTKATNEQTALIHSLPSLEGIIRVLDSLSPISTLRRQLCSFISSFMNDWTFPKMKSLDPVLQLAVEGVFCDSCIGENVQIACLLDNELVSDVFMQHEFSTDFFCCIFLNHNSWYFYSKKKPIIEQKCYLGSIQMQCIESHN